MLSQVCPLLLGDHLFHQFHGRVVFSAVFRRALFLDGHLIEFSRVRFQFDHQVLGSGGRDIDDLGNITHRTDGQFPSIVALDGEFPLTVARDGHFVATVDGAGVRDGPSIGCIYYFSRDLCFCTYHRRNRYEK